MKHSIRKSILLRMLINTSSIIIIGGILLIGCCYFIQKNILENQLNAQALDIIDATSSKLTPEIIEEAMINKDPNSTIHTDMRSFLDELPTTYPLVELAYIFGVELHNGNETTVISISSDFIEEEGLDDLALGDYYKELPEIVTAIQELKSTGETAQTEIFSDDFGTWKSYLHPLKNKNGEIIAYYGVDIDTSFIVEGQKAMLKYALGILLAVLISSIGIYYLYLRKAISPLRDLGASIDRFSQGQFDCLLKEGEDEIGQINKKFNDMVTRFQQIVYTIKEAHQQNTENSKQLIQSVTKGNQDLHYLIDKADYIRKQMVEQQASTQESSHTLNEIVAGVANVADRTMYMRDKADDMEIQSNSGKTAVDLIQNHIHSVKDAVNQSKSALTKLNDKSAEINGMVETITNISNQTNLLALNAAIEAARAGEHGRGFSIVASEVGALAQQSKEAADHIYQLISTIQEEIKDSYHSITSGTEKVSDSVRLTEQINNIFHTLTENITNINQQIQEITASTQQSASEAEEIASIIEQLSVIAKENTDITMEINQLTKQQETSYSKLMKDTEKMNALFEKLHQSIAIFKL